MRRHCSPPTIREPGQAAALIGFDLIAGCSQGRVPRIAVRPEKARWFPFSARAWATSATRRMQGRHRLRIRWRVHRATAASLWAGKRRWFAFPGLAPGFVGLYQVNIPGGLQQPQRRGGPAGAQHWRSHVQHGYAESQCSKNGRDRSERASGYGGNAILNFSNILIRATNWVGDAVMCLPALRAIREPVSRGPHHHSGEILGGGSLCSGIVYESNTPM